jgi:hypothetical protein
LMNLRTRTPERAVTRVADCSEVAAEGVVQTSLTAADIAPIGAVASGSGDLPTGSFETDAKASILLGPAIGTASSISYLIQDNPDILHITGVIGATPAPDDHTSTDSPFVGDESRHHSILLRGAAVGLPEISSSVQTASADPAAVGPPVEASPVRLIDQLLQHVITSANTSGREVILKLNPPELGDLTVRVLVNGREVSAWFASPQVEVQQAITQALGQLHTGLGNAGYHLNNAWVGEDGGNAREPDDRPSILRRQQDAADGRAVLESPGAPYPSASSGLSIYV